MAKVYSTRLFGQQLVNGLVEVTVPAGFLWVVRHMTARNYGAPTPGVSVGIVGVGALWYVALAANFGFADLDTRHVLNPGEQLYVVTTAPADVVVSGYVLSLP